MNPNLLEIQSISKAFGGLKAVSKFDLQVKERDTIGIIGPNGAGKTTLFNLMTGFIHPDSGDVILKGENITRLKAIPGRKPWNGSDISAGRFIQRINGFGKHE